MNNGDEAKVAGNGTLTSLPGNLASVTRSGAVSTRPIATNQEGPVSRELIKALAEAVGKDLAAYVEVMYPEAMKAASSTFKLSLKNHVYNDIMHASTLHTEAEIRAWVARNDAHRKEWLSKYRKMRRSKSTPPKRGA